MQSTVHTATLTLCDGRCTTGYTYNGGRWGAVTAVVITHDLADFLIGQDTDDIAGLYHKMHEHLHYVGRGEIVSFAISALDIALWDFRAKAANLPLRQVTGGASDRCKIYAGGIDLAFPRPKLLASIEGYLVADPTQLKLRLAS